MYRSRLLRLPVLHARPIRKLHFIQATFIVFSLILTLLPNEIYAQAPAPAETYITNAHIIDVEKQRIVTGLTVVVRGNRIVSIGKKKAPKNATVIDATGNYLMPGLTDAHVHFFQSGGLYTRPDIMDLRKQYSYEKEIKWTQANMEDQLRRYVQNGITTVYDVGATNNFLQQKNEFADKSFAPTIFMAGPLLTSSLPDEFKGLENNGAFLLVKTPEEAREAVRAELLYKPDLVKIWYLTDLGNNKSAEENARSFLPCVMAAIDEAHKNNLTVAVHATEWMTARLAVEAGADYLVHGIDDQIIDAAFVELLKRKKTVLCPTLVVEDGYENTFGQTLHFSSYEIAGSNPFQLGSLFDVKHLPDSGMVTLYKQKSEAVRAATNTRDSIRMVNLKLLADGGVIIATGTDAGNIGTLHATSYFAELIKMKQSGLSNWQILLASTINGAKIVDKEHEFGSISVGKKADMILLYENPIEDINNLQKIRLVINKGVVIDPDTLIRLSPEALVQRQLNAYNDHNLEAFLTTYSDDIELFDFPDKQVCKGKEQMRKIYGFLNNSPGLHAEIKARIVQGNNVIDEEIDTGIGETEKITAVYQTENGKIRRVYFLH